MPGSRPTQYQLPGASQTRFFGSATSWRKGRGGRGADHLTCSAAHRLSAEGSALQNFLTGRSTGAP